MKDNSFDATGGHFELGFKDKEALEWKCISLLILINEFDSLKTKQCH